MLAASGAADGHGGDTAIGRRRTADAAAPPEHRRGR
jgi:hypothetical protein